MPAESTDQATATARFAAVVVDELVRRGTTDAVLAPGSRSTPVALALLADDRVRLHVRIDERSAAYLALGIAKASGRVVPVVCTSGTATSYLLGAVMEADQARVRLLALTTDRPPELRGIGANQTVDQVGLYGTAVRWSLDAATPGPATDEAAWRALIGQAVVAADGGEGRPPGPVHLNLPLREPLVPPAGSPVVASTEVSTPTVPTSAAGKGSPPGRATLPAGLLGALAAARNVVVVAGDLGGASGDALLRLAERSGWPVLAEPHSGLRRGPNAIRAADVLLRAPAFDAGHRPDLVVVAGRVGLSRPVLEWLGRTPHVVVDAHGSHWDVARSARAVYGCDLELFGGVDTVPAEAGWLTGWRDAATRAGQALDELLDAEPRLSEPAAARDLAALLPAEAVLVVAASMPIRDLDLTMTPREDLRVMANRGASGIDGFVSTVQGVALARSGPGPVVGLTGDLSLLHDSNGLLPGPDVRPSVTYVVINNDGGGIFSLLPQGGAVEPAPFERVFGTPHGVDLAALAAAYRLQHRLVATRGELADALAPIGEGVGGGVGQAAGDGAVRLVEVRTDRRDNAGLHARLREAGLAALAG